MGSLFKSDVVRTALNEVGYQGGKGTSKYTRDLDNVNYWQMPPKDGCPDADWCSIFVNWCIYQSTRNSDGEIDPDKWDAHYFTFEPDSGENLAAGCGYAANYYMDHDAWSDSSRDAAVGDQIFFRNFAHTGLVIDWGQENGIDMIYTVEGNASGYQVVRRSYRADDPCIDGYGHPRYDGAELAADPPTNHQEPTPEPTPEPVPGGEYIVSVGSTLNIRTGPGIDNEKVGELNNGAKVSIIEERDGWARISSGLWVSKDYLFKI